MCKDCKYWNTQPPGGEWINIEGLCGRIYEGGIGDGLLAETGNHWGDDSFLRTKENFGCILFEAK